MCLASVSSLSACLSHAPPFCESFWYQADRWQTNPRRPRPAGQRSATNESPTLKVISRIDRLRTSLEGVPREQKMLKAHLPRVKYHQVYCYMNLRRVTNEPNKSHAIIATGAACLIHSLGDADEP